MEPDTEHRGTASIGIVQPSLVEEVFRFGRRPLGDLLGPTAYASARIGAYVWDLRSGAIAADDIFGSLFGYAPGCFPGTVDAVGDRMHPLDRDRVARSFGRTLEHDTDFEHEYRVLPPGAPARWVHARGRLIRGDDGTVLGVVGAAMDATAREQGEASTARLLEAMPTALFMLDTDWRFTYLNVQAEKLLGFAREEILGQQLWQVFPEAVGSEYELRYRTAVQTGEPVQFDMHYPAPQDTHYEVHAWPGPDGLAVYLQDVTILRRAAQQERASVRKRELISAATAAVSGALEPDQAMAELAELIVPDLADWSIVTLVEDNARRRLVVRDVAAAHRDPAGRSLAEAYARHRLNRLAGDSFLHRVMAAGRTEHVPSGATPQIRAALRDGRAQEALDELAPSSCTMLPLRGRGRTVGMVSLFNGPDRAPLTHQEIATAEQIADRAGLALDNLRLSRQQARMAERLQRAMLSDPMHGSHLQVAVRYVPAAEAAQVGGDWYDTFTQPDGSTMLVIGDVVGHDDDAAATMGQLRSMLRALAAATTIGPADVVTQLQAAMTTLGMDALATLVVAQVPPPSSPSPSTVTWTNAAHPTPVLLHQDGRVRILDAPPSTFLGLSADTRRKAHCVTLCAGDTLVLFTDGLVERRDAPIQDGLVALQRALTELASQPVEQLCDALLRRMLPPRAADDVALLAVRFSPP